MLLGPFSSTWRTEQDVRECIVRPLIRALGFSDEMVTTEVSLSYKRRFLGRKKPRTDPLLRGDADFLLDVDGRLRVIVESKKPGPITEDDREQAYTYAMHPQVRAVIFVVISGTEFEVWSTVQNPTAGPILEFTYEQVDAFWRRLENVFSPAALRRDFAEYTPDIGAPLAPGLRSFAKVEFGLMHYDSAAPEMTAAVGLTIHFSEGSLERKEEGGLVLRLRPSHPYATMMAFQRQIAEWLILSSTAEAVSTNATNPTLFSGPVDSTIPKGFAVPHPAALNQTVPAPFDVRVQGTAVVHVHLEGAILHGIVVATPVERSDVPVRARIELRLR